MRVINDKMDQLTIHREECNKKLTTLTSMIMQLKEPNHHIKFLPSITDDDDVETISDGNTSLNAMTCIDLKAVQSQ